MFVVKMQMMIVSVIGLCVAHDDDIQDANVIVVDRWDDNNYASGLLALLFFLFALVWCMYPYQAAHAAQQPA